MKAKMTRARLVEALNLVTPAIRAKDQLNNFAFLRIEACAETDTHETRLVFTGGSENVQVSADTFAEVEEPGVARVLAARLKPLAASMEEGVVTLTLPPEDGMNLRLDSFHTNLRVVACGVDFESMKAPAEDSPAIVIPAMTLREMLRKTAYAAARDDVRPALKGVCFEVKKGTLTLVSVDGKRMAVVSQEIEHPEGLDGSFVLHPDAIEAVLRLIDKDPEDCVTVEWDAEKVRLTNTAGVVLAKLPAQKFPAWRKALPSGSGYDCSFKVDRPGLLRLLSVAMLAASREDAGVTLTWKDDLLTLVSQCGSTYAKLDMPCKTNGQSASIKLNGALIKDAIDCCDDDEMVFYTSGVMMPLLITCSVPYQAVIMPLHVAGESK